VSQLGCNENFLTAFRTIWARMIWDFLGKGHTGMM